MDSTLAGATEQASAHKAERTSKILLYAILFIVSFVVFFIWTFPYDMLFRGAIRKYAQKMPAMQPFVFEEMNVDLPLGASFKNLAVGKLPAGPMFEADSFGIKLGLFKAMAKKTDASFEASAYGGKLNGTFAGAGPKGKLNLKYKNLALEKIPAFKQFIKLDAFGNASGQIVWDWSSVWQENKGDFSLSVDNGGLKNVNLKIMTTDFKFTKVDGSFLFANNVLTIKKFILEGSPTGFEFQGTITLNPENMALSTLDLSVVFTPTAEFEKNTPLQMLEKEGEGRYKGHFGGTFANPTFP